MCYEVSDYEGSPVRPDRELLKGTTETSVLAVLAAVPCHGYELIERLRRRSGGAIAIGEGTLYPMLYKLESAGWVRGTWKVYRGRRRRVYRLTSAGRRRLDHRTEQWHELVRGMKLILSGAPHAP